ncbi:MAG: anaerobic ribonucleoside-triphosphate reductase activating protein [Eubacteriales bacterium]
MQKLRIAGLVKESTVDGPGIRFTVFVQGCPHHCEDCHNPHTHDFDAGTEYTVDELFQAIKRSRLINGVTLSGGEPFCQAQALSLLAEKVKMIRLSIITYTGFVFEDLVQMAKCDEGVHNLLKYTDYLIDGRFEKDKKDLSLLYRGSSNQRILDLSCYPGGTRPVQIERAEQMK